MSTDHANHANHDNASVIILPIGAEGKLDELRRKLGKRADKLGMTAPTLCVWAEINQPLKKHDMFGQLYLEEEWYIVVEVIGTKPSIEGYDFIGRIDHSIGEDRVNLVWTIPGEPMPKIYRNTDANCDHCGFTRKRKQTFILRDQSGQYAQIGRNCLQDYIGCDPTQFLNRVDMLRYVYDSLNSIKDDVLGGSSHTTHISLSSLLKITCSYIDKYGWTSKKIAIEYNRISTSERVSKYLWSNQDYMSSDEKEEMRSIGANIKEGKYDDKVEKVIAWASGLSPDDSNDYLYNLYVIANSGAIPYRLIPFAVSMVAAYDRNNVQVSQTDQTDQNRSIGSDAPGEPVKPIKPVSSHQGVIGNKYLIKSVKVDRIGQGYGGQYGTSYPINFIDMLGNVYVWWASNIEGFEVGSTYDIVGTIKGHSSFRDVKQTNITRVKIAPKRRPKGVEILGE